MEREPCALLILGLRDWVWSHATRFPEETGRDGYGIWAGLWRVLAIWLDGMQLMVFEGGGLGKEWKMSGRI